MNAPAIRPATPAVPLARKTAAGPPCVRCGNPKTEPLPTMRLCTSAADGWFRCDECAHVFSASVGGA